MPEQPNYCTGCGVLMSWTNAAYYCSEHCMNHVRNGHPKPYKNCPACWESMPATGKPLDREGE